MLGRSQHDQVASKSRVVQNEKNLEVDPYQNGNKPHMMMTNQPKQEIFVQLNDSPTKDNEMPDSPEKQPDVSQTLSNARHP